MRFNESISDKQAINFQIENILKKYKPAEQTRILDALEALQQAGKNGLSPADWAAKVKELHPDNDFKMSDLLSNTVKNFQCCVKRLGPGIYAWDDSDRGIEDVSPETRDALSSQIRLSNLVLQVMTHMGEFTLPDVAQTISQRTGMPLNMASEYAKHIIDQFRGSKISDLGNGEYKVNVEPKNTADDQIANLKRLAGLGPDTDKI